MAGEATTYLDETNFKRTLQILEKERDDWNVTRWQKFFLYSFTILVGIGIIGFIFLVIIEMIKDLGNIKESFSIEVITLIYVVSAGLAPLFFLFNIRFIYRIFKFNRLIKRLDLAPQLEQVFSHRRLRTEKGGFLTIVKKLFKILFSGFPAIVGIILSVISIIGLLFSVNKVLYICTLIFGPVLMSPWYLLRGIQRLRFFSEISNLENSLRDSMLRAQGEGNQGIEVPTKEIKRIAIIERSQIELGRAKAIQEYKEYAASAYVVSRSPEASKAISALDSKIRVEVVEKIETLSSKPYPSESVRDPHENYWRLEVPHAFLSLIYTVDDAARQIKIINLASLEAGSGTVAGGQDA